MPKKAVLGRGLSALLPSETYEGPDAGSNDVQTSGSNETVRYAHKRAFLAGQVAEIPVDLIVANPFQPRTDFDETSLRELAASIRQLGIIQPITVRAREDTDQFELISGERRLRAARIAQLDKIPAFIRLADTEAMLEMAIVENIHREDLNPIEIALGYQRLLEECQLTQDKVAERVGKNRSTITNFIRLLRLPPPVQVLLRDGSLSAGHARMLVAIDDEEFQIDLARKIADNQLSVRAVERLVKRWHREDEHSGTSEEPISHTEHVQIKSLTDRLRTHYSTQVNIRHKANGTGKIELAYFSNEELERLLEMLTQ